MDVGGEGDRGTILGEKVWGRVRNWRYPGPRFGDRWMTRLSQRQWPKSHSRFQGKPLRLVCPPLPPPKEPGAQEEGSVGVGGQGEAKKMSDGFSDTEDRREAQACVWTGEQVGGTCWDVGFVGRGPLVQPPSPVKGGQALEGGPTACTNGLG